MLPYPDIDPVAIALGPIKIHWYGLTYIAGLAFAWWLARRRSQRPQSPLKPDQVDDLIFYAAIGVVLGGRFGYVFFYGFERLLSDPMWLFRVWEGGMAFHGGLLGVLVAMALFARQRGIAWGRLMDFVAPLTPVGLALGRLGNFIGQELWGRATDVPWAMVFPAAGPQARHPSQLYQLMLEGLLLAVLLWWFARRPQPLGRVSAAFLMGYGGFRFVAEYFREPDNFLGLLSQGWSMGQWLSLPMVIAGAALWWWSGRTVRAV